MIDPIELHALADGELSAEQERDVRARLAQCSQSQAELQAIVGLKAFVNEKTPAIDCRQEWKACVGRIAELDRTRKVEKLVSGRFSWALCGAFGLLILGAGFLRPEGSRRDQQTAELARMVASLGPSRSASPQTKALNHDLDSLLNRSKVWIDPQRMEIKSRAYGSIDGHEMMRLTLRDPNGDMALIAVNGVLPLDGLGELPRDHSIRLGHVGDKRCVAWTDSVNTFVLIADRAYQDLATTASRITLH